MSSEYAIEVNGLGKCYQIYDKPSDRLKQMLARGRKKYYKEFWALNNVSFKVKKGETIGIIGRNGSGKSTLLQMICGTLNPTAGEIKIHGRVAALLELGAGFNPEFTGLENVYMAASLYGLDKAEVDQRFDAISGFADIGDHINHPVKTYSSGMYVRLAFSVIAHVDADILVIDEALAVGDVFFQQKCMRYLRKFKEGGGSLLFVSHDTPTVMALCDKAVLLRKNVEGNNFPLQGSAEEICKAYLNDLYSDVSRIDATDEFTSNKYVSTENLNSQIIIKNSFSGDMTKKCRYIISAFNPRAESFGTGNGKIISANFRNTDHENLIHLEGDQRVTFAMRVRANKQIDWPLVGIMLKDRQGQIVFTEGSDPHFRGMDIGMKSNSEVEVLFSFCMPCLLRGNYTLDLAFANGIGDEHTQSHWMHDVISIECIEGRHVHGIAGFSDLEITWKTI